MPKPKAPKNPLFDGLRSRNHKFDAVEMKLHIAAVDKARVQALAALLGDYLTRFLPAAIAGKESIQDYRTNPYVMTASAAILNLSDPTKFAEFLLNTKFFMGLETSFGKSIEGVLLSVYPSAGAAKWRSPPEKDAEFAALIGLPRQQKAKVRNESVWREIDREVAVGSTRYLCSIKSGPNTINDTQVQGMADAIKKQHGTWLKDSEKLLGNKARIDIVVGLTYGTAKNTNNKENQILAKLLGDGFSEENGRPGTLIDDATGRVRVYRVIGRDFWSFVADPKSPDKAAQTYLEVLLGLGMALKVCKKKVNLEERINGRMQTLAKAMSNLQFPKDSVPPWLRAEFSDDEWTWLVTAMTAFFDEGI